AGLPQRLMTEEEDLCIQQRNFRVEQQEPEPPQIKEESGEICIIQDEDQLDLKQETDTLMEIPTYEENENSEADLNNQQSFNVTDSQDEEGNQHEESTSITDEETDQQNRDQRKKRDRSHVQSVDSSHMSTGPCDSDVRKNPKKTNLGKTYKKSQKEEKLSSIKSGKNSGIITNPSDYMETGSDERCYICKECGKSFCNKYLFRIHTRIHAEGKRFSCKECEKSFSHRSSLKTHMRTHTGEMPFSCKECNKSFRHGASLKRHMMTHTGEKPFFLRKIINPSKILMDSDYDGLHKDDSSHFGFCQCRKSKRTKINPVWINSVFQIFGKTEGISASQISSWVLVSAGFQSPL
uniref:C2H2-type domain-containing protein n=1 Tax=Oryzias latipes TaxID=8090 RepID=A0A3P9J2U6_ORYLA